MNQQLANYIKIVSVSLLLMTNSSQLLAQECKKLCEAIRNSQLSIGKQLVSEGVSVNCKETFKEDIAPQAQYFQARNYTERKVFAPIHLIAYADDQYTEWLTLLTQNGANINTIDNDKQTLLHLAAETKNVPLVQAILAFNPIVDIADGVGNTPLQLLIDKETTTELVTLLIDKGANPKKTNTTNSPLIAAFKHQNLEVATLLILKGASVWETDLQGMTCLDAAVANNDFKMVQLALASGMNGSTANMKHLTNEDIIRLLIANGADVRNVDLNNVIAYTDNTSLVQWLIEKGADVNQKGFLEQTPLYNAIKKGNLPLVQFLVAYGAMLDYQREYDNYLTVASLAVPPKGEIIRYLIDQKVPLWGLHKSVREAVQNEDKAAILFLITSGLNLDKVSIEGLKSPSFGNFLLQKGADINRFDLSSIIETGKMEMVHYLDKKGINLDASNAIYHAVAHQQIAIIDFLLSKKANPNLQFKENNWHYTPLMKAIQLQNLPVIQRLVTAGANLSDINDKGETVIQLAVLSKNAAILDYLLMQNINFADNNVQHTALLVKACIENDLTSALEKLIAKGLNIKTISLTDFLESDNPDIIQLLVQYNVKVSTPNTKGQTPLYYAFKKRYYKTVNYLLEHNANINDICLAEYMSTQKRFDHLAIQFLVEEGIDLNKTHNNKTPIQLAIENDDLKMLQYLVKHSIDFDGAKAYRLAKKLNATQTILDFLKSLS